MSRLTHNPDVIHTDLEDGAVLLHMTTGYYYSLDGVGLAIWRELPGRGSVDELARFLARRFEVKPEDAAAAARRFLARLEEEALVAPADGPSPSPDGGGGSRGTADAASDRDRDGTAPERRLPFEEPQLLKHDEPLTDMVTHPFDPQLPLAE